MIDRVDPESETVFVSREKDEIKNAPEYDEERGFADEEYRGRLGGYYDVYETTRSRPAPTAGRECPGPRESIARVATILRRGPLAQLVEQGTLNPKVEGSSPSRPMLTAQDRNLRSRFRSRQDPLKLRGSDWGSL